MKFNELYESIINERITPGEEALYLTIRMGDIYDSFEYSITGYIKDYGIRKKINDRIKNEIVKNPSKGEQQFIEKVNWSSGKDLKMPGSMIKKLVKIFQEEYPDADWLKQYYDAKGISPDTKNAFNDFKKELKNELKYAKKLLGNTVYVDNPNWQGITGSTKEDRMQFLPKKTSEVLKYLEEYILDKYNENVENGKAFLNHIKGLNLSGLQDIIREFNGRYGMFS